MTTGSISSIVAGGLGTDIFGLDLERLVGPGELGFGGNLHIGAGGKSRNIAEMIAKLLGPGKVAMVGRTSKDALGLWRVPVDALEKAGVCLDFVKVLPFEATGKFPQVALIAVDKQGKNQIYVLPGVNETFCGQDIADALPAFQCAKKNSGLLALSLEMPLPTVITAIKQANEIGLRTVLDPGGIRHDLDAKDLLAQELYLIKPNEHEAHILTGIKVSDQNSALEAAKILRASGAKNVLLTMGGAGAYLLAENASTGVLLPIPQLKSKRDNKCDETGCGDQTMAALCAALLAGCDLLSATKQAMLAGTLQFFRLGIIPVTREELDLEADEMLSGTHL